MPESLSRDEFVSHIGLVRADLHELKDHLLRLNDRTGESERDIAVLKDRACTRGRAAWVGGGLAGSMIGLMEAVKWWLGKP